MNDILEKIYTNGLQHNKFFMQQLEFFVQLKLSQKNLPTDDNILIKNESTKSEHTENITPIEESEPSESKTIQYNQQQISSDQLKQNNQQDVISHLEQLFKQVQDLKLQQEESIQKLLLAKSEHTENKPIQNNNQQNSSDQLGQNGISLLQQLFKQVQDLKLQQEESIQKLLLAKSEPIESKSSESTESEPIQNDNQQFSSYQLGQNGQQYIISLLQQLFKQVQDQSQTPHVGDILVEYNDHKIMIEVKNKQSILKEDIEKFKEDSKQFDLSIFISLQTDYIYSIGQFDVQDNLIYLSKDYINIHTFTLLKSYMDLYFQKQIQTINTTTTNEDDNTPDDTEQYINLQIEKDLKTILVFKNDLKELNNLFKESQLKQQELEIINQKINAKINAYIFNLSEYQNLRNANYEIQKQELQQLLETTPSSKLRKIDLLKKFDTLQLHQYTIKQIVDIFKPHGEEKGNQDQQKQELQQLLKTTPSSKLRKSQLVKQFDTLQLYQYTMKQIIDMFKPNEEEKENSTK